jgi:CBS domain containing-hemolysin-like protein
MKTWAEEGNQKAKRVMRLADKYDNVLTTILIGNNIVNILSASLATLVFIDVLQGVNLDPTTLSTIVMTIIVLIFGEIIPKSVAKQYAEGFAMFCYPILRFFMVIFFPLTWIFGLLQKSLKSRKGEPTGVTEKELITIVEEAEEGGQIDEEESELIRSAIEFDETEAIEIFTPRVDVVAIPIDSKEADVANVFAESGYSRIPVYKGTIDNIVGIINQKDFYTKVYGTGKSFRSVMKPPVFVMPSIKVSDLLSIFQKSKSHIAIISDEFGGTEGIVTMEDILEELVGEIWDEHDDVVEEITKIDDDEYKVLGTASVEEVFEQFNINYNDEESDSSMVGGWVTEKLGQIPREGDSFMFEDISITVAKTEYRRIIEVIFKRVAVDNDSDKED